MTDIGVALPDVIKRFGYLLALDEIGLQVSTGLCPPGRPAPLPDGLTEGQRP